MADEERLEMRVEAEAAAAASTLDALDDKLKNVASSTGKATDNVSRFGSVIDSVEMHLKNLADGHMSAEETASRVTGELIHAYKLLDKAEKSGLRKEAEAIQDEIDKMQQKLKLTDETMSSIRQRGMRPDPVRGAGGESASTVDIDTQQAEGTLARLRARLEALYARFRQPARLRISREEMDEAEAEIEQLRKRLDALTRRRRLDIEAGSSTRRVDAEIRQLRERLRDLYDFTDEVKVGFGGIGSEAKSLGSAGGIFERLTQKLKGTGKEAEKTKRRFIDLRKVVVLMALRSAVRAIFTGFTEAVGELAKFDTAFNSSMSRMYSALLTLRNAMATMFAPLINALAPLAETLMQKLSGAAELIGKIFAGITGAKTFTRAVPVVKDYAASLEEAKDNTAAADKAAKKLSNTLMGFDEFNILNNAADDTTASSGTATQEAEAPQFETVALEQRFTKLASIGENIRKIFSSLVGVAQTVFQKIGEIIRAIFGIPEEQSILDWFLEKLAEMMPAIASIVESICSIIGIIATDIAEVFKAVFNIPEGESIMDWLIARLQDLADWLSQESVQRGIASVVEALGILWLAFKAGKVIKGVIDAIKGILPVLSAVAKGIGAVVSAIVNPAVLGIALIIGTCVWASDNWDQLFEGMKEVADGFIEFLNGVFSGDLEKALEGLAAVGGGILSIFGTIVESIIKTVTGIINGITSGINSLFGTNIGQLSVDWEWSDFQVPALAGGGVVNSGQMFLANEAGPELVGNVGTQTAVMNNAQIVDAVSAGVARAVASVMNGAASAGGVGTIELRPVLDGKVLFESVIDVNNAEVARTNRSRLKV